MSRPHGLEFVAGKLYFTAEGAKVVGSYDPAARKVDWVLDRPGPHAHDHGVERPKRMITTNVASGSVSFIEQVELPTAGQVAERRLENHDGARRTGHRR